MESSVLDAEHARNLLFSHIIPEINDRITEACEDRKSYIRYVFDEDIRLGLRDDIMKLYINKGYIVSNNDTEYIIAW